MTTATMHALPVGSSVTSLGQVGGRILAWSERNGYHDSYFSSLIAFDAPDGGYVFTWVETGATAYGGGFIGRPNCTDETILEAYRARRAEVMASLAAERARDAAKSVTVGKRVVIIEPLTRGKNKTAAGATGEVTWRGENNYGNPYGTYETAYRVKVALDGDEGREVFIDEQRVRVAGYEAEDLPVSHGLDYLVAGSWPNL